VPFNSDEAIVALMGRHIQQGERPIFFYGQAYMGSLDAWLVALSFRLFGESVITIRIVQVLLYLLFVWTLWLIASQFFQDRTIAGISVLIAAVPPVLVTTYTTATLGGYGETIVLGNFILWVGYRTIRGEWRFSWLGWLTLGLIGGLAFWTLGLSAVYLLPIALLAILKFRNLRIFNLLLALSGFFITSYPWWYYNLTHQWEAVAVFTQGTPYPTGPVVRLVGLLILGIPALLGLRFPWTPELAPVLVQFILLIIHLGAIIFIILNRRFRAIFIERDWALLFSLQGLTFIGLFVGTQFGIDSTGRYLLPLFLPLCLLLTVLIGGVYKLRPIAGYSILGLLLLTQGFQTWRASNSPPMITTQFDPITAFDNTHDAELMAFLEEQHETLGYSNYWVTYRLAFLSEERLIFSPELPYKADLRYTPNDKRYPPYGLAVAESPRVAYITTQHPDLNLRIRDSFKKLNVKYKETDIGPYHIFFELSEPIRPAQLDLSP
jgi:4-amino-4-deoxy-L-arabinose transferase-like glycosyltransferase